MAQKTETPIRRLGRGLSSLVSIEIPSEAPVTPPAKSEGADPASPFRYLNVSLIEPNKNQPRKTFSDASLAQLADSIKVAGVMQPVVVRAAVGGRFELVAGERRWRAAQLAGLNEIPAVVRELSDMESAQWAVVENVQREDLNAIDRAWALRRLHEQFGLSHAEIGQSIGMDRTSIANLIRLTELEDHIAKMVVESVLSAGHARALLALPPGESRHTLANEAVRQQWNVRKLEEAVRRVVDGVRSGGVATVAGAERAGANARDAVLADLERQLGQHLGTKVAIRTNTKGTRGTLTVEFYGLDHFDGLLAKLGVRHNSEPHTP